MKNNEFNDKKIHRTWSSIVSRYKKGEVDVLSDWLNNYEVFKEWALNNGYDDSKIIKRINKSDSYNPENCEVSIKIGSRENLKEYHQWKRVVNQENICDEWKKDFTAFLKWCNEQPKEKGFVLLRIDKDEIFSPENCVFDEPLDVHGKYHKLHEIYNNMKSRCEVPSTNRYERYGGRGIKVCKEWKNFYMFKKWSLENGYKDGLSIERIDVDGNYEPNNCEWIPLKQQHENKSNTVRINFKGKEMTLNELSELTGISRTTLYGRHKSGLKDEELLYSTITKVFINGSLKTFSELEKETGINADLLRTRYRSGIRGEELLSEPQVKEIHVVDIRGKKYSLGEAAEEFNLLYSTVSGRYLRGIRGEDLIKPVEKTDTSREVAKYEVRGELLSLTEISKKYNIKRVTLVKRAEKGLKGEELIASVNKTKQEASNNRKNLNRNN